jgi:hypothetical protein
LGEDELEAALIQHTRRVVLRTATLPDADAGQAMRRV